MSPNRLHIFREFNRLVNEIQSVFIYPIFSISLYVRIPIIFRICFTSPCE
ncbi:hypothetical protein HOD83_03630, partial [Candidatus Woesearchaeota archaeon]|nr:hypothetical protein [Candidatus Woesearchaeota archaeon]